MKNQVLHSEDTERAVLSALIMHNENYYRADGKLTADLFYNDKNKDMFLFIQTIIQSGQVADVISVSMYALRQKSKDKWEPVEVLDLCSCILTDVTFMQNVLILCELYERRRFWLLGQKLITVGTELDVSVDDLKLDLIKFLNEENITSKKPLSMADANNKLLKRVEENMSGVSSTSILTGFRMIDNISGFQGTDLNVIAAESSQGKTTFLINILVNAAMNGVSSVLYSLEMDAMQLASRINSSICNLNSSTIQYKQLTESQYIQVKRATEETSNLPIYFDENSTSSIETIVESIHTIARRGVIKLFAIDYLQILCSVGKIQNQELFLGEVARTLKNIAKKYNICIIILSQLRKSIDTPFPTLDRLRGSGQIREAADNIFFIYRPEAYKKTSYKDFPNISDVSNTAEIIWAKGRNTGTAECVVGFDTMQMKFYDKDFSTASFENTESVTNDETTFTPPQKGALPF